MAKCRTAGNSDAEIVFILERYQSLNISSFTLEIRVVIMLSVRSLNKSYREAEGNRIVKVLNNIDLEIEEGEFVAIMGASGAGKTTLLNALSGMDRAVEGELFIGDQNLRLMDNEALLKLRRQSVGFVFQEFHLLEGLTMFENIALPATLLHKDPSKVDHLTKQVMRDLNITELAAKFPWQASRGQQQRVAIARAIVNGPKVIFADEPTGNLDYEASKNVLQQLKAINQSLKATIVMVTHDHDSASYADRVIVLVNGRVGEEIRSCGNREYFLSALVQSLKGAESDF